MYLSNTDDTVQLKLYIDNDWKWVTIKLKHTEDKILVIDLGINTDATCSVMRKDRTILARKFINFASDKDQINHTLNKIKGVSQKYGSHNTTKL